MGPTLTCFNGFEIFWYRVTAKWYRVNSIHTNFSRRISWEWFWIFVSDGSSRKATSNKNNGSHWGPQGSPPMGSLGLPRVPTPMGPLPWDPFGLPRVPSHGIPPHLPLNFCPAGQNINYKRINQRLFSKVSYCNWGGFDKTEVSGKMVRNFVGPVSPIFCLTE